MRAMIVAAGRGTRLAPLTQWRPKPAVPVRGVPLVGFSLALLAKYGVKEVIINTHHLPDILEREARDWCPPEITLSFSHEDELLGTGGGIKQAANFLAESEHSIVIGGDMILDFDLSKLLQWHIDRQNSASLLLKKDPREPDFGTIGIDETGSVRRIARRFDLGGEDHAGIYTSVNVFSARAFESMPARNVFNHLDDWILPGLANNSLKVGGYMTNDKMCTWEPVGTIREYLLANFGLPDLSYLNPESAAGERGTIFKDNLVIGHGVTLDPGARLDRVVVWDNEHVPGDLVGHDGVFAEGSLHGCPAPSEFEL